MTTWPPPSDSITRPGRTSMILAFPCCDWRDPLRVRDGGPAVLLDDDSHRRPPEVLARVAARKRLSIAQCRLMRGATLGRRRMLLALLIDVLLLSLAGYVVLLVIAVSYWGASTQPFSVVVSAATGGAFLAFVIVPPTYVAIGYWAASSRRASGSGAAPEEEVPSTDQEMPADPQPHPEQERARHAPPGDGGEDIAQPRSVEDRTAQLPQHERDEDGP